MRILRNSSERQILVLSALSTAARFGLSVSVFIILMSRFEVSPVLAAAVGIGLQGFAVATNQISKRLFRFVSLSTSQKIGAVLGVAVSLLMVRVNSSSIFLMLAFLSSFSRVALEATFPRVTHSMIVADKSFASKFVGVQQGSFLFVCAIIAPIALSGSTVGPMLVTAVFYVLVLAVALFYPSCGVDSFEEIIGIEHSQEKFDRRFGDIARNEDVRISQSRIHKFRRTSSTLLSADLFINIIMSGSVLIMPLCFRDISKISQAFESIFAVVFGITAAVTGLCLLPRLKQRFAIEQNREWTLIAIALPLQVTCSILYTSFLGPVVAGICAALSGFLVTVLLTSIQQLSAKNLTINQFQDFGCKLQQRSAIAKVVTPIVVAVVVSLTTLTMAVVFLVVLASIFSFVTLSRVILVVHGRKLDYRLLDSIGNSSRPARKLRTRRRSREDVDCKDTRIVVERFKRERVRSREKFAAYNRIRISAFIFRAPVALPQENSHVDATRGSPG